MTARDRRHVPPPPPAPQPFGSDLSPAAYSPAAYSPGPPPGPTAPCVGGLSNGEKSVAHSVRSADLESLADSEDWSRPVAAVGAPGDAVRDIFNSTEELELQAPLIRNRATGAAEVNPNSDRSAPSEEETVDFGHNGYTLILMSGRIDFSVVMVGVAAGQFGVLWLVAWSSPEYFFESGQWNVPISDYWSVNLMKCFALFLTLFRVTGEFKDATKIYRVLYHKLKNPMSKQRHFLGGCAFALQYLVAILVLFMAIHLILASTTPIATIGKLWVVYIVLDFDNHWCNFMLYILHLEDAFEWKVVLKKSKSSQQPRESLLCYFAPVCIGLAVVAYSLALNICPLTRLHYGTVRNADPVLMLTSTLGLPQGCCPPQVEWDSLEAGEITVPANVSVPCLSPGLEPPLVYYVVLPDGRPSPSSLQVIEGRGGDGNLGLRYGRVATRPLQMHWWLSKHGFSHNNIYEAMQGSAAGGLGLYSSNFPYVAQWEITDFPWTARVRVFAAAKNSATGALSPAPVLSAVILRKVCPSHCSQCSSNSGACWRCEPGFALQHNLCQACAQGCEACERAGEGRCDAGGCKAGFGLESGGAACLPCAGDKLCESCDASAGGSVEGGSSSRSHQVLACRRCKSGHGLAANGSCIPCPIGFCDKCPELDKCKECLPGRVLQTKEETDEKNRSTAKQECLPCAEHCSRCDRLGAGKCDPERCEAGYSLSPTGLCNSCSAHCSYCTKSGPGNCDAGHCKPTYGLQGYSQACVKCQAEHCDVCDKSPPTQCDACAEGFGLTPERSCEACADSCKRCTDVGDCAECNPRFGLDKGKCFACADQCAQCEVKGPGQCDPGHCLGGWASMLTDDGGSICIRNTTAEVQV